MRPIWRRPIWIVIILAALGGAIGVRARFAPRDRHLPVGVESLDGLIERLGGEEDESAYAQAEIERRAKPGDLSPWKQALESSNSHSRYLATDSLAKVHSPEACDLIFKQMEDYDARIRVCAIDSLGALARQIGPNPLIAGLQDEDEVVRESAIVQLRILSDPRTVPAALRALHDTVKPVVCEAMHLLRGVSQQNIHVSMRDPKPVVDAAVAKWEAWWRTVEPHWTADPELALIRPTRVSKIGPFASDFEVDLVGGGKMRLSDLRGKVVLVNFWATWCLPCRVELPALIRLHEEYQTRGVVVVGLAISEKNVDVVREFARERGMTYPVALATDSMRQAFGQIDETPVTFLLDREGRVRYEWEGDRGYDTFATGIKRLLLERQRHTTGPSETAGAHITRASPDSEPLWHAL